MENGLVPLPSVKAESRGSRGFTLVEIMMGMLILTIALITFSTVFSSISNGIFVNKTKTIATNLAQEKIESLKNVSYYRLLVSTALATDPNFPGMVYDQGTTQSYYPEEILNVGGLVFKRRALVDYVSENNGDLVPQPWTANDTGIKRITVYVVWQEGQNWKSLTLVNLRNNPQRAQLQFTFSGKVSSGATGNGIYNALVETVEDPSFFDRTDANGNYSFKVQPGTYTLRASATGYFTSVSTGFVAPPNTSGSQTQNFQLSLMATGNTTGYAFIQDHLVITSICVDTSPAGLTANQEWVEFYNPTNSDILIASRSVAGGPFDVFFVTVTWIDDDNKEPELASLPKGKYLMGLAGTSFSHFIGFRSSSTLWTVNTPTISVPSQHFFLVSNMSTVTLQGSTSVQMMFADAYYNGDTLDNASMGGAGGVRVTGNTGHAYGIRTDWHDGVAWYGGFGSAANAQEGPSPYPTIPASGNVFYRTTPNTYPSFPDRTSAITPSGNCYDTDNNLDQPSGGNWYETSIGNMLSLTSLFNSDTILPPGPCTPAAGASVSSTDGMSQLAYVQAFGSYTLVNMATGTWTVTISSGAYTRDISTVTITSGVTTGIPNNATTPTSLFTTNNAVALTNVSIYGYISGQVTGITNNPLANITVSAGGSSVLTNSQGRYRIPVTPSTYISVYAQANGYGVEELDGIGVNLGVEISTVNFVMVSAGSVKGFVTTNGAASGALPGVPVVAMDPTSSTVQGSAITRADGSFTILNVSTGYYNIVPQLESGENSSPVNAYIKVIANSTGTWSSTFTVTNAFGQIVGEVAAGDIAHPITTGVIVIATTGTITTDTPPAVDSSFRSGSQIFYSNSSDAAGNYSITLRGNASYYIYAWYPNALDVSVSSAPKRQVTSPSTLHYVSPGASLTRNILW